MQISSSLAAGLLDDARSVAPIAIDAIGGEAVPVIDLGEHAIGSLLGGASRSKLDELLPDFLHSQRWFAGKGAVLDTARLGDSVAIPTAAGDGIAGHIAMLDVRYADGTAPERYAAALVARPVTAELPEGTSVLARVHAADGEFLLADSPTDVKLVDGIVHSMRGGTELEGAGARIAGEGGAALDDALTGMQSITVEPLSMHTSNTSVRVTGADGRREALKLVRRHDGVVEAGTPTRALDVWKGAYLTNEAGYRNTPAVLGSLDHYGSEGLPRTVAVLTDFVPNDGDGWAHALDAAGDALGAARSGAAGTAGESIDAYAQVARNHGRRLGELHAAFAGGGAASEFRGVTMGRDAIEARIAQLRTDALKTIEQLRRAGRTDAADRIEAALPEQVDAVRAATRELPPVDAIHTHGDFHLGQLLKTGDDVQIIDLEGAPALPLAQRWERASALGDVARQRSSYEYAAHQALLEAAGGDVQVAAQLRPVADRWAAHAKQSFLDGWLDATSGQGFRHARTELAPELREAELANALYETSYELGSRPDWVDIPLGRLERLASGG